MRTEKEIMEELRKWKYEPLLVNENTRDWIVRMLAWVLE